MYSKKTKTKFVQKDKSCCKIEDEFKVVGVINQQECYSLLILVDEESGFCNLFLSFFRNK